MTLVSCAIRSAAAFLEDMQAPDGMWRDFGTLAGRSSEWVTAFVVRASQDVPHLAGARRAAAGALVARQRRNGGWAFNRSVPTDCDSTAWSLLALATAGRLRRAARRDAARFLISHQREDGGFATFVADDGIGAYIDADEDNTRGWLGAHVCVTGVALQALTQASHDGTAEATRRARAYLLSDLERTGRWESYWWKDWTYSTYQALEGLLLSGGLRNDTCDAVLDRLEACQNADGGWAAGPGENSESFATAFGCLALMRTNRPNHAPAIRRGVEWLRDRVGEDGAVPSVPILRIPSPTVTDPGRQAAWREQAMGTGVLITDEARVFTTAAVLWALGRADARA